MLKPGAAGFPASLAVWQGLQRPVRFDSYMIEESGPSLFQQ